MNQKTTIYLDPNIKKFLQHKSVEEKRSMSEIINLHVADYFQDIEDNKQIQKRRKEETLSFEEVLSKAGLTFDDLRS